MAHTKRRRCIAWLLCMALCMMTAQGWAAEVENRPTLRIVGGRLQSFLAERFAAMNPQWDVQYEQIQGMNYNDLDALLRSDPPPDVIECMMFFGGEELMLEGRVQSLSANEKVHNAVDSMYPAVAEAVTLNGALYGLPTQMDIGAWKADESAVQVAGLHLPVTLSEFLTMARQYGANDPPFFTSLYQSQGVPQMALLESTLRQYVLTCERTGQNVAFNSARFRRLLNEATEATSQSASALDWLILSYYDKEDWVPDSIEEWEWDVMENELKAAQETQATKGSLFDLWQTVPLMDEDPLFEDGWTLIAPPPIESADPPLVPGYVQALVIPENSLNSEGAQDFVSYVAQNPDITYAWRLYPEEWSYESEAHVAQYRALIEYLYIPKSSALFRRTEYGEQDYLDLLALYCDDYIQTEELIYRLNNWYARTQVH